MVVCPEPIAGVEVGFRDLGMLPHFALFLDEVPDDILVFLVLSNRRPYPLRDVWLAVHNAHRPPYTPRQYPLGLQRQYLVEIGVAVALLLRERVLERQ